MKGNIVELLKKSKLMSGLEEWQILELLKSSHSSVKVYEEGQLVFEEGEKPEKLFILLKGKVAISKFTFAGRKIVITNIEKVGDVFGEVYLFMEIPEYEYEGLVMDRAVVLELENQVFFQRTQTRTVIEMILQENIMRIFAEKAYTLSNKVRLLGSSTLREKIAYYIVMKQNSKGEVDLMSSREELADYLNVTRPSLSRELGAMSREGIIKVEKRKMKVLDVGILESYL